MVVTEYGVAVNPKDKELAQRLRDGGVHVVSIEDLQRIAQDMTGVPKPVRFGNRLVAEIVGRDGQIIDRVYNVIED